MPQQTIVKIKSEIQAHPITTITTTTSSVPVVQSVTSQNQLLQQHQQPQQNSLPQQSPQPTPVLPSQQQIYQQMLAQVINLI